MQPLRLTIAKAICRYLPPIIAQRIRGLIYPIEDAINDDYKFIVTSQTGSNFKNRTSDFHGYVFCIHGYFDWRNWAVALALCSPGDTIIEIGANVGTETVGFSDIVGPFGKVYAFEPLTSNLINLNDTIKLNQFKNVIVFPFAVSNEVKNAHFVTPINKHMSGVGHILGNGEKVLSELVEVRCISLDSIEEKIGPAKMIYMDIEGAEINALRGARRYITKHRPYIVLEASPKLLSKQGSSINDLFSELDCLGYTIYDIARFKLVVSKRKIFKAKNIFCVPTNSLCNINSINNVILLAGFLPCIPRINPITR